MTGDRGLVLAGSGLWGGGLSLSCSAFPLLLTCSTRISDSSSSEVGKGKFRKCSGSGLGQVKPDAGLWDAAPSSLVALYFRHQGPSWAE